jgi:TPR repeat protein
METEDSPRAKYYRGLAVFCNNSVAGRQLIRQSAEAGFAPAMAKMGEWLVYNEKRDESVVWIRKAAELNDPDGLYEFAKMEASVSKSVDLFAAAVNRGHVRSKFMLASSFHFKHLITQAESEVLTARGGLLLGSLSHSTDTLRQLCATTSRRNY